MTTGLDRTYHAHRFIFSFTFHRYIGSESRFLPTPPAFDAPVRGFPSEYRHYRIVSSGVTLRLLVINISSSSLAINTAAEPLTTSNVSQLAVRWPCSSDDCVDNTWFVAALTAGTKARYIGSESRFLPTPPAFDAPVRGFPSEYRHVPCLV